MEFWTFCPDIAPPDIRANLPENQADILISGQKDLSINGWAFTISALLARIEASGDRTVQGDAKIVAAILDMNLSVYQPKVR